MNLQQLKVFVHVVNLQKLYLVAEKLNITQPTVTFHLNKLQEDAGMALFHTKTYHVIKLTEAGRSLYHYAKQIVALDDEMRRTLENYKETATECLRIGSTHTPATYILPDLLFEFRQAHHIYLSLDVKPATQVIEKIKLYDLDLGVISHTGPDDPDLIYEPLMKDDLVIIFHPEHILATKPTIEPHDLQSLPLIAHEEGSSSRAIINQWALEHDVQFTEIMQVSGSEALKSMVRQNMGIAMLSQASIIQDLIKGEIMACPIPNWSPIRTIYAVRHRNKLLTPWLQLFWNLLVDRFSSQINQ
ncbi:LysR family transcriptional regulator [Paenibacillus tundrae]|uniref:DNA-binding transcriptional LysR family regulator n=1 Tax=Paenibacillus tundrae TaxID=528187 RepID=A0ABT9W7Y1_9BACL|nr:LysR family transcriptional regulator [Paenibacillus tundrae]MDQ0169358.1 DNA-binding transcriptional LysR family regulator [Paenibacillus tundrae]